MISDGYGIVASLNASGLEGNCFLNNFKSSSFSFKLNPRPSEIPS